MILGIIAGIVTCALLMIVGGVIIRESWQEYAAVERAMTFTQSMLFTRLALSTIALLLAAWVTTLIARKSVVAPILGIVLLLVSVPIHIKLWNKFPMWYHLTFLVTLIPLCILGGRIGGSAGRMEQTDAKMS
jgi:hypothetical protein